MITSRSNPKVKFVRRLQGDRRFRQREARFVVEGTRWLRELAVPGSPAPELIFYTTAWIQSAAHARILHQVAGAKQPVDEAIMVAMSATETPPGILAVLPQTPFALPPRPDRLLLLDAITTPGNLGTMLRTAAAAGMGGVLLAPGCVDLYNPKTVRAGMGAHLRLAAAHLSWPEIDALTTGMAVWAAVVEGGTPYTRAPWSGPVALLIGSEARGVSSQGLALAAGRVTIPMPGPAESLNAAVAAGVLMFELARRQASPPPAEG